MTDYRSEVSNYDPTDKPLALRLSEMLGSAQVAHNERMMMGTKDWTASKLVECLSDNLPLSDEQRSILVTLVVQREQQDKNADRYRWIRNSDWDCFDSRWLSAHDAYGQGPDELDALVDAKMLEAAGIGAA